MDGEIAKLESLVEKVEARSGTGQRTSKATWMDIERRIPRTFRLSEDDKTKLVEGLQTQFTMCRCISEADLCALPDSRPVIDGRLSSLQTATCWPSKA